MISVFLLKYVPYVRCSPLVFSHFTEGRRQGHVTSPLRCLGSWRNGICLERTTLPISQRITQVQDAQWDMGNCMWACVWVWVRVMQGVWVHILVVCKQACVHHSAWGGESLRERRLYSTLLARVCLPESNTPWRLYGLHVRISYRFLSLILWKVFKWKKYISSQRMFSSIQIICSMFSLTLQGFTVLLISVNYFSADFQFIFYLLLLISSEERNWKK